MNFNSYSSLIFLLFNLLSFDLHATANCTPDVKMAPPCPTSGSLILDDHYPVAYAAISTSQGVNYTADFVKKVMFAQKPPIPIVVTAGDEDFQVLLRHVDSSNLTQEQKITAKNLLIHVNSNMGDMTNWQQDFFEAQFDRKTGLPVIREVRNYVDSQVNKPSGFLASAVYDFSPPPKKPESDYYKSFSSALEKCGSKSESALKVDFAPEYFASGMMGGNLEALPNGICLIGKDSFESPTHLQNYAHNACGTDDFLETPSDFLLIGHTDEFMNVIPDAKKPYPCNYAITLASPNKAMELLKQDPNKPLFSNSLIQSKAQGMLGKICSYINTKQLLKKSNQKTNDKLNPTKGTVKNLFFENIFGLNVYAFDYNKVLTHISKISSFIAGDDINEDILYQTEQIESAPAVSCQHLTNQDLIHYIEENNYDINGDPLPSSEEKLANDTIQNKMNEFKTTLLEKTKKHVPSCEPEIIDVPYIFSAYYDKNSKSAKNAISLFPNSTNGVLIGNKYIFSSLGNDVFSKYTAEQYTKKGNVVDFIDSYGTYDNMGGLHCSSHMIRYCNPR